MFNFGIKNHSSIKSLNESKKFLKVHLKEFRTKEEVVSEDLFDVTAFLLEEIIDMYESLILLYEKNHFRSCIILARSILENSINLQYIYNKDIELRASNYKLFSLREYVKRAKKTEKMTPELLKFIEELEKIVGKYNPSGKRVGHWDGKTVRDQVAELKIESMYDTYRHLSNFTHSKFQGNRDLSGERPYLDFLRKLVLRDIMVYILPSLQAICERFDLNGGLMVIHDYDIKSPRIILYATNPKKNTETEKQNV